MQQAKRNGIGRSDVVRVPVCPVPIDMDGGTLMTPEVWRFFQPSNAPLPRTLVTLDLVSRPRIDGAGVFSHWGASFDCADGSRARMALTSREQLHDACLSELDEADRKYLFEALSD